MTHPVLALMAAVGLLGACVAGTGHGGSTANSVVQGAVKIVPPSGYCIDHSAGHAAQDRAVVVMGRCSASSKQPPALMTVSVGPSGSAAIMGAGGGALAEYFTSPGGRAVLSRRGRPADVKVVQALSSGDAFLMRLQEVNEPAYWRAVLGLKGQLVTLSVKAGDEAGLDAAVGRKLMDSAVSALSRVN